uniref:SSD domain-containing protein n=1 Tax=Ascaris lumbricoides TaxID=6252 RepID=A0A0M3I1K2_ASCLU
MKCPLNLTLSCAPLVLPLTVAFAYGCDYLVGMVVMQITLNTVLVMALLCADGLSLEWISAAREPWSAVNVRLHKLAILRGKLDAVDLNPTRFSGAVTTSRAHWLSFPRSIYERRTA